MGYWPRHPRPELEAVLVAFDAAGWRIQRGNGYYRVYCPCRAHQHSLHLTPSDPNYAKNQLGWLRRQPCYREG